MKFKTVYTDLEKRLLRKLTDLERAQVAMHELLALVIPLSSAKQPALTEENCHDFMVAQVALVEALHDSELVPIKR